MDGISSLSIGVVFHQLGAPSKEIFSSVESFFSRSSMLASRNERDIGMVCYCRVRQSVDYSLWHRGVPGTTVQGKKQTSGDGLPRIIICQR